MSDTTFDSIKAELQETIATVVDSVDSGPLITAEEIPGQAGEKASTLVGDIMDGMKSIAEAIGTKRAAAIGIPIAIAAAGGALYARHKGAKKAAEEAAQAKLDKEAHEAFWKLKEASFKGQTNPLKEGRVNELIDRFEDAYFKADFKATKQMVEDLSAPELFKRD